MKMAIIEAARLTRAGRLTEAAALLQRMHIQTENQPVTGVGRSQTPARGQRANSLRCLRRLQPPTRAARGLCRRPGNS